LHRGNKADEREMAVEIIKRYKSTSVRVDEGETEKLKVDKVN
jgi:hypothetical protein